MATDLRFAYIFSEAAMHEAMVANELSSLLTRLATPLHEQGTAVARRDPRRLEWHAPDMGWLVCQFATGPSVRIEMDEFMAIAYLESFGRASDAPLVNKRRVISATFVLTEHTNPPVTARC